ncbi:hypothetical protein HAX54_027323 [Datura stramonium]|uniref:Uncharacterized protein n=1 Tax=Datura stramonium TaxID=4076 RepID=A0ABS8S8P8_DATST|nr:hypothetical protein [Datura stramonium]
MPEKNQPPSSPLSPSLLRQPPRAATAAPLSASSPTAPPILSPLFPQPPIATPTKSEHSHTCPLSCQAQTRKPSSIVSPLVCFFPQADHHSSLLPLHLFLF